MDSRKDQPGSASDFSSERSLVRDLANAYTFKLQDRESFDRAKNIGMVEMPSELAIRAGLMLYRNETTILKDKKSFMENPTLYESNVGKIYCDAGTRIYAQVFRERMPLLFQVNPNMAELSTDKAKAGLVVVVLSQYRNKIKDVMEQMDDRATADMCDAATALVYLEGVIERMLTAGLESNFVFETFRSGFTLCFKNQIEREYLPYTVHLSMLDVSETVRSTFIARLIENPQRLVHPAFHGTFESNFPSISERGFLIPGAWNGIRMRNGCTYGRGIYFANINAPDLALSFSCSSMCLLVCALLKDDKVIRSVRDCQVVFDPSFCVPLFVARPAQCNRIRELSSPSRAHENSAREVLHRGYKMAFKLRVALWDRSITREVFRNWDPFEQSDSESQ